MTHLGIDGLTYLPGFITQVQHDWLVRHLDTLPWLPDLTRRVQHYGWKYDYRSRQVTRLSDLPNWLTRVCGHLSAHLVPDQVIVNDYQSGQRITPHVDARAFGPVIASLSLVSAATVNFGRTASDADPRVLTAEPRSLYVLAGEARTRWYHAVPPVATRRISVTFRTVLGG